MELNIEIFIVLESLVEQYLKGIIALGRIGYQSDYKNGESITVCLLLLPEL